MKKKVSVSLILIVMLAVVMAISLVACNRTPTSIDDLPDDIGGQINNGTLQQSTPAYLKFYFPMANSVFQGISLDEFDISDVEFSVVYVSSSGVEVSEVPLGNVTEDMVAEEDRPKLKQPGHHEIHISTTLTSGETVSGTTKIHLKDDSGKLERVTVTITLHGGYTSNGELDMANDKAIVKVDKGYEFTDWQEFISTFRVYQDGWALSSVTVEKKDGTAVTLSPTEGFPFVLDSDCDINTVWTHNVITVTFDLNLPQGNLERKAGAKDPSSLFAEGGEEHSQSVEKMVGTVERPDANIINVYSALYFVGWYTERTGGTAWNFRSSVGNEDFTLYARWTERTYSFTLYTMGGGFAADIQSDVSDSDAASLIQLDVVASAGSAENVINRIIFTGFTFNQSYDKYYAEFTVGDRKVTLKFSDFYGKDNKLGTVFAKGTSFIFADSTLYKDSECTEKFVTSDNVTSDGVAYVYWMSTYNNEVETDREALSNYFTQYLFKDGYTIKSDGSIRLDKASGEAVNEIIIPAQLKIDDTWHNISEIGPRACLSMKALTKVDIQYAANLTAIGEEAFAQCGALKEIAGIEENDTITSVGNNAFRGTPFEDNYSALNHGKQFIVVNRTIYKYVGDEEVETLDLSSANYYTQDNMPGVDGNLMAGYNIRLNSATNIMSGAFSNAKDLKQLKLSIYVERIENGAFSDLEKLVALIMPVDSHIAYIGENAFNDVFLSSANTYNYNESAIYIGHILYRMINRNATSFLVPASVKRPVIEGLSNGVSFDVTAIAPMAFTGCTKLSDIKFANNASNITVIGRDAFLNTAYIQHDSGKVNTEGKGTYVNSGLTVVNGILTEFYGTQTTNVNVVVPSTGDITIAEYAFNNYATNLNSILLSGNVTEIANNAFSGAVNLKALILSNIEVEGDATSGYKLVDAPAIYGDSFDNTYGEMNAELKFYFRKSVMDAFAAIEDGAKITDNDAKTEAWYNMYLFNKDRFVEEKLASVSIDSAKISQKLLRTGESGNDDAGGNAFLDKYGKDAVIEDALIVKSNAGVERREPLSVKGNQLEMVEVSTNDFGGTYSLKFVYQEQDFDTNKGNNTNAGEFLIEVYDYRKIENNTSFYTSNEYNKNNQSVRSNLLTSGGNGSYPFWLSGLEGDTNSAGDLLGSGVPTFWSSSDPGKLEPVFNYLDYSGNTHSIAINLNDIDGLSFTDDNGGRAKTATIEVDFHGIGTYMISFAYIVRVPKYEKVEQRSAFSVPLNGNANTFRSRMSVIMIREDGSEQQLAVTNTNGFSLTQVNGRGASALSTDLLGFYSAKFEYNNLNLATKRLEFSVIYSVVLQEDPSLFTFVPLDEVAKTAKITSTSLTAQASTVRTVVVPKTCTIDGKTYTVTQIGEKNGDIASGVFAGLTNLVTVYLSSNIKVIGNFTFAGCVNLKNVYTAQETTTTGEGVTPLAQTDFMKYPNDKTAKAVGKVNGKDVYEAIVTNVPATAYEAVVERGQTHYVFTLESEYEFEDVIYRVIGFQDKMIMPNPVKGEAEDTTGDVYMYLPSSIYLQTSTYFMDGIEKKPIPQYGGISENVERFRAIVYDSASEYRARVYSRLNTALTDIGNSAFARCSSLTSVDLTSSTNLALLGPSAFGQSGITSIDLSKNSRLTDLAASTFGECVALKQIVLPTGLKSIQDSCFNGCESLVDIYVGEVGNVFGVGDGILAQLSYIGNAAFSRCTSLLEMHLWKGIETVGNRAFATCYALTVYVDFIDTATPAGWNSMWRDYANDVYPQAETVPVVYSDKAGVATDGNYYYVAEYIVKADGTIEAAGRALEAGEQIVKMRFALDLENHTATVVRQSSYLTNVVIPATVSKAGDGTAFNVTAIGEYAFKDQTNLTSVTVQSVTKPGSDAKTINLTSIGDSAFMGCVNLATTNFNDFDIANVAHNSFSGCTSLPDAMNPAIEIADPGAKG